VVILAIEAGLQRGTLVMQPADNQLPAVAGFSRNKFTVLAAMFKSVQNRQSEIGNRKFVGSCSKTRTTSSAPAPRAAQWEGRMSE
jgi:hypothetical protein